jgi:hypothetical protein
MAKKTQPAKRGRGRPKSENPMSDVLRFRVVPEMATALESYRKRHRLLDASEAARQALASTLRNEGLFPTAADGD